MSIVGSEQWMYSSGREFYDFPIEQSLRFNRADSAYLNRTASSPTLGTKATWSFWIKKCDVVSDTSGSYRTVFFCGTPNVDGFRIGFARYSGNDHVLHISQDNGSSAAHIFMRTEAALRDTSSFYNIVIRYDSTDATAADRIKVYINGELASIQSSPRTNPSLNFIPKWQVSGTTLKIGKGRDDVNEHYDMYLADVNFVDGTAYTADSFGELKSGIWIPKDTADLTFGTNGFRLQFGDSAAIGDDTSGNTNDWTVNNLVASDVVLDSPTNNFATHNPLASLGGMTFTEGNLEVRHADIAAYNHARSTMGMTSGKWYWEWYNSGSSGDAPALLSGIVNDNVPVSTSNGYVGQNTNSYGYDVTGGARYYNGSNIGTISVPTGDSSGVYMVAYDADNGNLYFGANGTWANSGNPATGTGALFTGIDTDRTWFPAGYTINNDAGRWREVVVNHGQDSTFAGNKTAGGNQDENGVADFFYSPPSGFLSLCSANLPTGAIDTLNDETPEDYFNTVLYSGNSTNNTPITVGFQPSMTWIKTRNVARDHRLMDAVRGATAGIYPNLTNVEGGSPLISFDTDGFTLNNTDNYNNSGETYVSWNWKANGSGVSNTDGDITSTVSVGATSQQPWFSIVGYTGDGVSSTRTIGCGLEKKPDLVILKNRTEDNVSDTWFVYGTPLGSASPSPYLTLYNTDAVANSGVFVDTAFSDNGGNALFAVSGSYNGVNKSGTDYIAYCFANAEGLCKVGSYGPGTGNSDGPFVYTGFRPAFILVKGYTTALNWIIWDNKRLGRNPTEHYVVPDLGNAESSASSTGVDFLSNGFKFRGGSGAGNLSGANYIYLAIAEQPFKYANAR